MVVAASALSMFVLGLSRPPMIGVACHQANSTSCGRVGIAVWLDHPATAVRAKLGGALIRLHAGGLGGRGPTYWEGYVHLSASTLRLPAYWYGADPPRYLRLRLRITYPSRVATGAVRLRLNAGWG